MTDPRVSEEIPAPAVDPRVLRDVLGHFASGVTVVTAETAEGPIGFTCQSFSSLYRAGGRSVPRAATSA